MVEIQIRRLNMHPNSQHNIMKYVANTEVFESVKREISSNLFSQIPQPVVIIGEEGSGKTTLLRRLQTSGDGINSIWIDGRRIFSSDYIIDKCREKKASIVYIDDIDYYFSRCSYEDQFKLRGYLYSEGSAMLIATASKVVVAFAEYDAPFFEGIKVVYINPISKRDVVTLFDERYRERVLIIFELLSPTIKSVIYVSYILELNNDPQADIQFILFFYSDKFKKLYNEQPSYSQKILNALGTAGKSLVLSELREISGLPTNILTPYIKGLRNQGIIKTDEMGKRNMKYYIKDPLFILWLRINGGLAHVVS